MNIENHELRTSTLWKMLFKSPSAECYLNEHDEEVTLLPFDLYISALCKQRGEAPDRVIRRADIEKSYGHSLFRGRRRPSRDTVLQLAFGFNADFDMAQSLLKHAGHSPLYPRVPRDVVIGFCIKSKMNLLQTQNMLVEKDLLPIGRPVR